MVFFPVLLCTWKIVNTELIMFCYSRKSDISAICNCFSGQRAKKYLTEIYTVLTRTQQNPRNNTPITILFSFLKLHSSRSVKKNWRRYVRSDWCYSSFWAGGCFLVVPSHVTSYQFCCWSMQPLQLIFWSYLKLLTMNRYSHTKKLPSLVAFTSLTCVAQARLACSTSLCFFAKIDKIYISTFVSLKSQFLFLRRV